MTNKTIALSRELAELYWLSLVDNCSWAHELRALLDADPVPPAGGEVEVLAYLTRPLKGSTLFYLPSKNIETDDGDIPLVDLAHVTRLQAEVERLEEQACHSGKNMLDQFNRANALQSELAACQQQLTKARELLEHMLKDDDMPVHWFAQRIDDFLSNQSAPADKGRGDAVAASAMHCSFCDATDIEGSPWSGGHETYNGDLIYRVWACKDHKHLGDAAINAAKGEPAKPYGYMFHPDGKKDQEFFIYEAPTDRVPDHNGECWTATPLYAEQPAPVAVVIPERAAKDGARFSSQLKVNGWNACLDEFARLNSEPKP